MCNPVSSSLLFALPSVASSWSCLPSPLRVYSALFKSQLCFDLAAFLPSPLLLVGESWLWLAITRPWVVVLSPTFALLGCSARLRICVVCVSFPCFIVRLLLI